MRERGFGRVVAIGSMAVPSRSTCSSSPTPTGPGLVATFKVLARQYASDGVTFNTSIRGRSRPTG